MVIRTDLCKNRSLGTPRDLCHPMVRQKRHLFTKHRLAPNDFVVCWRWMPVGAESPVTYEVMIRERKGWYVCNWIRGRRPSLPRWQFRPFVIIVMRPAQMESVRNACHLNLQCQSSNRRRILLQSIKSLIVKLRAFYPYQHLLYSDPCTSISINIYTSKSASDLPPWRSNQLIIDLDINLRDMRWRQSSR